MPQSLARVLVHLVFSTKHREPLLVPSIRPALHGYLASVGRDLGCEVFRVGGMADHVHLAVDLARTVTLADLVKKVKQTSSVWIKEQPEGSESFEWQVAMVRFPSANPNSLPFLNTSGRKRSIIARRLFRRNTSSSWPNTACRVTNGISGIEPTLPA